MGNSSSSADGDILGSDRVTPRLYEHASKIRSDQWPIVYSPVYNIGFLGFEKLHPFDSGKWGKVHQFLIDKGMLKDSNATVEPEEANLAELLVTHSKTYLDSLKTSYNVAMVVEVPLVAALPNSLVQQRMLRPFRYQTAGTIMAGKLARDRGWAVNIGGGFHHCSSTEGGGFCAYADITLCVKFMFSHLEGISKVMIVDLDAHQGNGYQRDFLHNGNVHIMDVYNKWIYPHDTAAKAAIDTKIELNPHTENDTYLDSVQHWLPKALDNFQPNMVVYNAGTDILLGDALGALDITPEGVIERDRIVFNEVRMRGIPILMVTSGGYQRNNAEVIADSIINLKEKGLIFSPETDPHVLSELKRQGVDLTEHGARLGEQGEELGEQGVDLTEHGARLGEQGEELGEEGEELRQHELSEEVGHQGVGLDQHGEGLGQDGVELMEEQGEELEQQREWSRQQGEELDD